MAKGIYVGVLSDVPIYEEENIPFSYANIFSFFTHTANTGSSYWTISEGTNGGIKLVPNNIGVSSSTATITLTAVTNLTNIIIKGAYYTEDGYDEITLTVNSSTILSAVSGSSAEAQRWTGSLAAGETIVLTYSKDGSVDASGEANTNFTITCDDINGQVIVGYEQKGIAKKVKKLYRGINGIARKVKKGYIGDESGVARLFFNRETKLVYVGTAEGLSKGRKYLAAASNGNYMLFGGGYDGSSRSSIVDAYDNNLTRTKAELSAHREILAATSNGNYMLFGGGENKGNYFDVVDAYDSNLTHITPTTLSVGRSHLAATSDGNYMLFGGGTTASSDPQEVDAYDNNLTRTMPTGLSEGVTSPGATSNGKYMLFGGGLSRTGVNAYDNNLTRTTLAQLNADGPPSAASNENYMLFGGGAYSDLNYEYYFNEVTAYDGNLTRITPTALSVARGSLAATGDSDYVLFGGGYTKPPSDTVDAYDNNLIRTIPTGLSAARYSLAATSNEKYMLFGGGNGNNSSYYAVVDVYKTE